MQKELRIKEGLLLLVYGCSLLYVLLFFEMGFGARVGVVALALGSAAIGGYFAYRRIGGGDLWNRDGMELKEITEHLSVGVLRCSIDDPFDVRYASASALQMMGYGSEEIFARFGGNLASIVNRSDVRLASEQYMKALKEQKTSFEFEYRLRHKSGREIWISQHARIAQTYGGKSLFSVLLDITAAKTAMQAQLVSEECYRIIYDTAGAILLDYDVENLKMVQSGGFAKKFGWTPPDGTYPEAIFDHIHPEDIAALRSLFLKIYTADDRCAEDELRICTAPGAYVWCKVELYGVSVAGDRPTRLIGKITDIDEMKRASLLLQEKSTKDPLTGILNKTALKEAIERCIAGDGRNCRHAFAIMDVDDFKRVNDRFGHMEGDRILKYIAHKAVEVLAPEDIVGRIGGDEFIFFVKNVTHLEVANQRVNQLFDALKTVIIGGEYPVSVSIGIAIYPDNATTHDDLYWRADLALYRSKHAGKNTVEIFNQSMEVQ